MLTIVFSLYVVRGLRTSDMLLVLIQAIYLVTYLIAYLLTPSHPKC